MEKRITEITTGMKTFTKELYHKSEEPSSSYGKCKKVSENFGLAEKA